MDLFQTYPGGMTNVNTADLYRMQYSTFFGLERIMAYLCRASYAGQYVLTGGNVTVGVSNNKMRVNIPKGYYIIGSKLCCLKSNTYSDYVDMTQTNTIYEYNASDGLVSKTESGYSDYFVNLTQTNNYDPLGDKTFANGTVRQTWLVQGFTISITSTQSTYYFCRLRIKHSDNTVTLVEAPKNIYDVIGYRYGDTAREGMLLNYGGDHNARMRLLTQHDYYLMNGGFINGVAQLGVGDLTINTTDRIGKSIYLSNNYKYDTTVTVNTLLDASMVYADSSLFRPTANDISQILIDKVDFVYANYGDNKLVKSVSCPTQTDEVNYLSGVPSSVKIAWQDERIVRDIANRIIDNTTIYPDVDTNGAIDDGKTSKWQNFTYTGTTGTGNDRYATTNLLLDSEYYQAPRPAIDFNILQISYRIRIK